MGEMLCRWLHRGQRLVIGRNRVGEGLVQFAVGVRFRLLEWSSDVPHGMWHVVTANIFAPSEGASRIGGPQQLGVYGRPLDATFDPSAIMGVKKQQHAEVHDPNEVSAPSSGPRNSGSDLHCFCQSSLEQSEIQSRLRLWQERQEQIERQQYAYLFPPDRPTYCH